MVEQKLRFSNDEGNEFIVVLRKRVNQYFKENNISKTGNSNMMFKTVFMLSLYFVPYAFSISNLVTSPWTFFGLWLIMGLGMSGIGLSIMHDANHGSFSKNKNVNQVLSYLLDMVGGSSMNWRIQHNVLHHSFTNVEGVDVDIKERGVLRFSPHQKRNKLHQFQHIYAWFLYGIMSLYWVTVKDFLQMGTFKKGGHLKKGEYKRLVSEIIGGKIFYYAYIIAIPLILTPFAWYTIVLSFLAMHFIAGFILTCIFQTAHVMPTSEYPLPDANGQLENSWAIHQLKTTTNYAPKSVFFSWFVGGLNFQVEHHLFPNICHVHYKRISGIVKETAQEYNLPYYYRDSFMSALWQHTKMLRTLGNKDLQYNK
jgi:linoleoyl-CoA desaturase